MTTTAHNTPQVADDPEEVDPDSGTERERDLESPIEEPFNPEQIRIIPREPVIELLLRRHEHKELDLAPDFQRLEVWNLGQRSRFIESLLLRIPIPVFYVAADASDRWSVVDGVQRLSTIIRFANDEYRLRALEFLKDFEGKSFSELPHHMQRRIRETQLIVNVIDESTPSAVMYNVFLRVNTGGVNLNAQEIRHAVNPGEARTILKDLANSEEFKSATDRSVNFRRMADRELVLRFMAFHMRPWTSYDTNSLDGYLHDAMKRMNGESREKLDAWMADFKRSMRAANSILGDDPFRKPRSNTGRRRPVNKALFEVWSTQIAAQSVDGLESLARSRRDVTRRFRELIENDRDFNESVSYSTSSIRSVKKRHGSICDLVSEFI